jgi:predicted dehydrogenase (TIGR03970 family)
VATFDYVIVGAGSAGATLAARLSDDPSLRVMLVEAGPDYPSPAKTPADLLDARRNAGGPHDWQYVAAPVPGRSAPYSRGKVVGGTSAINAALAIRATPADFDEWAALGNPEWAWKRVLPFLQRLEDDHDYRDDRHGAGGPIPVCRWLPHEWLPEQACFYSACRAAGFADLPDHNHPGGEGVGSLPMNRDGLQRVSTARAYLDPARHRPNLTILPHSLVDRVRLSGTRAAGVDLARDGERQTVHADRVVLSAGAINSPAILLRSGLGPADDLTALGIRPVVNLPGVGKRLWDHPSVPLWLVPHSSDADFSTPTFQVAARYTDHGQTDSSDMFLFMASCMDLTAEPALMAELGTPVALSINPVLMKPRAAGRLTLASTDPREQPAIALNYMSHPEDLRRLMAGLRLAWAIAQEPEMTPTLSRVAGMDDSILASDSALAAYVMANVDSFCPAAGTARMGDAGDAQSVVNQRCRVQGVDNLWVVDASVMPTVPSVPPNLTTIMIAERVADWLKQGVHR